MSELDNLLDSTLDDLADLPEFKPFPPGAHRVTIQLESKEINKKPAVELKMKLLETMELSDASAEPLEPGAETNCLFILKNNDGSANEISQGQLKNVLIALRDGLGVQGTNREIMEAGNGTECLVVTKLRENKNTKQMNTQLVTLSAI